MMLGLSRNARAKWVLPRMATAVKLVAVFVVHLLAVELSPLRSGMLAARRRRTMISVAIIEGVVYVAVETMRTMEPRTCTDKDSTREPFGAIVPVWSARVGWIFVITVWADRRSAYLNRNLCVCPIAGKAKQASSSQSRHSKAFQSSHIFHL